MPALDRERRPNRSTHARGPRHSSGQRDPGQAFAKAIGSVARRLLASDVGARENGVDCQPPERPAPCAPDSRGTSAAHLQPADRFQRNRHPRRGAEPRRFTQRAHVQRVLTQRIDDRGRAPGNARSRRDKLDACPGRELRHHALPRRSRRERDEREQRAGNGEGPHASHTWASHADLAIIFRAVHSTRSVLAGSTCAALRAGSQVATEATAISMIATMTPIAYGFRFGAMKIPCAMPILSAATLTGSPIASPTRPVRTPETRNIRTTRDGSAPTAMRMPISRIRWRTASEITPYRPNEARSSASAPAPPAIADMRSIDA